MVKGLKIQLLDNSLIRRFGKAIIVADPSVAKIFITKNLAREIKEKVEKEIKKESLKKEKVVLPEIVTKEK